ncbi:putative glycosyltransferase EpsJ [Aquimixticola soesokkakensis]|uniref:Putative glycosyltransferase EpsJ n=1 Tax=Aquimixticola soesokkakensis TaxID=1519096 RepID=A0A1Y5SSM3_9RHOB|nr:glycosyltransferase family 2 protein [Aquimixticola soesokkakensis]SLN44325.1 putative glycosyltransferase EpsJ [Aquimixticola soesokkakensis]
MTLLTIIIPFYNETAFLRCALQSIAAQRLSNVEILVINDNPASFGPADLAPLCEGVAVRILHHTHNRGLSAARNTGLDAASGVWIGFLDADDYYTTTGLFEHLAFAQRSDSDMVHAMSYISHRGSAATSLLARDRLLHSTPSQTAGLIDGPQAQFIVSSWSSLYKRAFLTREGLRFDEAQTRFEDRLFVLDCVMHARSIAYFGHPVRVWRRRAGSISVTPPAGDTHLLQVQLLEKCLGRIRAAVARGTLAPIFEKRELFVTVSRLIWDMEILDSLARHQEPALNAATPDDPQATLYRALGARVQSLLGSGSFGHEIFDDPQIALVSRVGQPSRRGLIRRTTFFDLHRLLRNGDFRAAQALIAAQRAKPPATARPARAREGRAGRPRITLHLGQHKTGSTNIQHHLLAHRDRLLAQGILVPLSGLAQEQTFNIRRGGFSGHQELLAALARDGAPEVWDALAHEIRAHAPRHVVISCENMLMPMGETRDDVIPRLVAALGQHGDVSCIAVLRDPSAYVESLYRERVSNGTRTGNRSLAEFIVDQSANLLDLPAQFAPFEAATGTKLRFGSFEDMRATGSLWQGFCKLAGLGEHPTLDLPIYPSPDRETIEILRILSLSSPSAQLRQEVLRGFFSLTPPPASPQSALSPEARLALLAQWESLSADFAAARGYRFDLAKKRAALAAEDWQPLTALRPELIANLIQSLTLVPQGPDRQSVRRSSPALPSRPDPAKDPRIPAAPEWRIVLRPKPWVLRLSRRARRLRTGRLRRARSSAP